MKCLNSDGYYQAITTLGIWRHKWCPFTFYIIEDDFIIEYVVEHHSHHLRYVLKENYTIIKDWSDTKLSGIGMDR